MEPEKRTRFANRLLRATEAGLALRPSRQSGLFRISRMRHVRYGPFSPVSPCPSTLLGSAANPRKGTPPMPDPIIVDIDALLHGAGCRHRDSWHPLGMAARR